MSRIVERGPIVAEGARRLVFDREGAGGQVSLSGDEDSRVLRKELIERVTQGEHIELLLTACTFAQGPGILIRKPLLFTEAGLASFAERAPGTPFQHSHSLRDQDCGGLCQASRVDTQGEVLRLLEDVVLNTPRSVTMALRGNMRKFSISWEPTSRDSVLCSKCKAPILRCDHYPGQKIDGSKAVIRLLYTDVRPIERSVVMFPAVDQTGTEAWRTLSALRDDFRQRKACAMEWNDVLVKLGLGESAGPADVANELARLNAEVAELEGKLGAVESLEAKNAELEDEKQALAVKVAELEKRAGQVECDRLIESLAAEGRITPGGAREKLIRECYQDGNTAFAEKLAATYRAEDPIVPVGERQSSPDAELNAEKPAPARTDGDVDYTKLFASLPEHVREMAGPLASDPEKYIRSNPQLCAELGLQTP